ncbi:MAG: flagellar hook capping protein [Firmicutes bacterium]|nr:flagellar hook capping protein [Bacillota bacterium]
MYVTRSETVSTYSSAQPGRSGWDLGKNEFLQLLVTQLRNMDIWNGSSNQEFIAQMAQFSTLEELQNLNAGMRAVMTQQLIAEASSMVGRKIEAMPPGYQTPIKGNVDAVEVIGGVPYLRVGEHRINMGHVTRISQG